MPRAPTGIELRHLRYFLAVVEELHFGRAAVRLHMAQPPLSQAIRKLEGELGVRLLDRTSRVLTPTEAGRAFAEHARHVLLALDRAVVEARVAGTVGPLRIDYVPYLAILPLRGRGRPDRDGAALRGRVAGALFLSKDHRLAAKPIVTSHDLRGEVHLTWARSRNPALHDRLMAQVEGAGYRFRDVVQVGHESSRDLLLAVAARRGVALAVASFDPDNGDAGIVVHARSIRHCACPTGGGVARGSVSTGGSADIGHGPPVEVQPG
jgi:DNA-binding transcriptional LysR family regulator